MRVGMQKKEELILFFQNIKKERIMETVILLSKFKEKFMKLIDELDGKISIAYGYGIPNNSIYLTYDMVDKLIWFSRFHEIKNSEIFKIIKDAYKVALMNTEVWKAGFCFEDIYNESDRNFKYIINSLNLREFRKFLDHNNWEKGMQAGIMADWDVVANTCASSSVMPSFIYYVFKYENSKWKKIDEVIINKKSIVIAKAKSHYGSMIGTPDYFILFRRTIFE